MTALMVPKLIALFGATGTGKTTFVNDASNASFEVGDQLDSCTQDVIQSPLFEVDGHPIILFDTPGFDDTELSDTEILKRITAFLTTSYKKGYKLTGVIYLHRITDVRMSGMSRRTFKILRELCGKDSLSNVIIATNMWSDPPTAKQIKNESQLRESPKFFQPAIKAGARMVRRSHMNTQSAHDVIRYLLDKPPVTMQIQRQIVDNQEGFYTTNAAKVLSEELAEAEQRHLKEIEILKEELHKAKEENDAQAQDELQACLRDTLVESTRLTKEIRALKEGFEAERLQWETRMEAAEAARLEAEKRQNELAEEIAELRRQATNASGEERRRLENAISELLKKLEAFSSGKWNCIVM